MRLDTPWPPIRNARLKGRSAKLTKCLFKHYGTETHSARNGFRLISLHFLITRAVDPCHPALISTLHRAVNVCVTRSL